MATMYFDALSFLEDERDAWRPFEALLTLPADRLERPVAAAHGWSGRDLLSHLCMWQQHALDVARELAVNEASPAHARGEAAWAEGGDALNERMLAEWRALPLDEVLRRAGEVAGELRGYLTVVPETRWVKHPVYGPFFEEETLDHYSEHQADLVAILGSPG
jgi:hypothetical protein